MSLLIDGYNLLHATGIVGRGIGPATLERSRRALLNFLAAAVDPQELPQTTIVFDAKDAPPGLPRMVEHKGITVRFAADYEEADTLIEELIRANPVPRKLTVVSSDHRLQRAARRRKATAVDSDRWYSEITQQRHARQATRIPDDAKPVGPLSAEEVERWLAEFGNPEDGPDVGEASSDEQTQERKRKQKQGPGSADRSTTESAPPAKPGESELWDVGDHPFPPGYAEDVLAEDEDTDNPLPSNLLAWRTRTGVDRFDEMWEGVLHMNAAPHGDHQLLQDDLREWLKRWWARPRKARAVCQRSVARSEQWPRDYRIPDIVLIPPDRQHFDLGDYIAGPPLVAIEICSPDDESYDKLPFYAEIGVPEVWIIDPRARDSNSTNVLCLRDGSYSSVAADEQGWTTSPATNVMMRFTGDSFLAVQIVGSADSYGELPED